MFCVASTRLPLVHRLFWPRSVEVVGRPVPMLDDQIVQRSHSIARYERVASEPLFYHVAHEDIPVLISPHQHQPSEIW